MVSMCDVVSGSSREELELVRKWLHFLHYPLGWRLVGGNLTADLLLVSSEMKHIADNNSLGHQKLKDKWISKPSFDINQTQETNHATQP